MMNVDAEDVEMEDEYEEGEREEFPPDELEAGEERWVIHIYCLA